MRQTFMLRFFLGGLLAWAVITAGFLWQAVR